jgi:two-component system, sensor histidine kinase PdtaS
MWKLILTICIIFCSGSHSFAQLENNQTVGELCSLLKQSKADSNRVELLFQLSVYYYFEPDTNTHSFDSLFFYLQQAKDLSYELRSTELEPEILCYLGKYAIKTGDSTQAHTYFEGVDAAIKKSRSVDEQIQRWKDLAWSIGNTDSFGLTRINCFEKMAALYHQLHNTQQEIEQEKQIADTHMKQGRLGLAEAELLDVLKKFKAIGFRDLHYTYHLLAVTNHRKGYYNKALYYTLLNIESMQKPLVPVSTAYAITTYSELAGLYDELGQTEKSIECYKIIFNSKPPDPYDFYMYREADNYVRQLIKVKRENEALVFLRRFSEDHSPQDRFAEASLARTFACYYSSVENYDRAEVYTRKMIALAGSLGKNNEIRGDVEFDIGEYYLGKKQFAKAAIHFQIALEEAVHNNYVHAKKDVQLMLFKTDSSAGNYASAIGHLNLYHQLKDSIFDDARIKEIGEIQAKYELERKEQNIRLLENGNLLQQNKLKQAGYTRNWILGGVVLLLIIMGLLINNSRHKQRTNRTLEIQRNDLRLLVKEKEWLVKEIHHRVKNNLQTISGLLDSQAGFLTSEEAVLAIRESQHRVNSMSLVHQKLYQSASISITDMAGYINELVAYLESSFNTTGRIRFTRQIERMQMALTHSIPIGLILNEAITNAIKYAFPDGRQGEIIVKLQHQTGNRFLLAVEDNGVGICTNGKSQHAESMGMSLMRGLSEDIGGSFAIEDNDGTKIKVVFSYEYINHVI